MSSRGHLDEQVPFLLLQNFQPAGGNKTETYVDMYLMYSLRPFTHKHVSPSKETKKGGVEMEREPIV